MQLVTCSVQCEATGYQAGLRKYVYRSFTAVAAPETSPRPDLVRPLPWLLFLPLLICLRLLKTAAELVASLRGREPPRPLQVVRYLRVRRRRLRAVKYHGLRNFESWQRVERNRQVRSHAQPSTRIRSSTASRRSSGLAAILLFIVDVRISLRIQFFKV